MSNMHKNEYVVFIQRLRLLLVLPIVIFYTYTVVQTKLHQV